MKNNYNLFSGIPTALKYQKSLSCFKQKQYYTSLRGLSSLLKEIIPSLVPNKLAPS